VTAAPSPLAAGGQTDRVRSRVETRRDAMRRRQQRGGQAGDWPQDGDQADPALVEEKARE
jgi:hypothetical protein